MSKPRKVTLIILAILVAMFAIHVTLNGFPALKFVNPHG